MRSFSDLQLTTHRLTLRPLQLADSHPLFRMHSDPEFMRYWSSEPWTDPARATALIETDLQDLAAGRHLRLGIFMHDEVGFVGTCSLFKLSEQNRLAELGYGIARPFWRQGLMHEAVQAVLGLAFDELGLNRVEADVDPRNSASCKSLEKLGFQREGLLRQRWIVGGECSDSAIYGLLAQDWRLRRHARLSP